MIVKAIVFDDEPVEGELIEDKMWCGGKKFIFDNTTIAVEFIEIIDNSEFTGCYRDTKECGDADEY